MLSVKMTPNLLGIEVEGDYDELNRLYDAVWELAGFGDEDLPVPSRPAASSGPAPARPTAPTPAEKDGIMRERLLALCYDLRHAYMGNRNVRIRENGMDRETAKWHGLGLPPLNNLYYSVEILYPEAMYEVMVLGNLARRRMARLVKRSRFFSEDVLDPRVAFDPVCALVAHYQSLVLEAVGVQTSAASFSRIRKQVASGVPYMPDMYTQWLDIVNPDWAHESAKKRKSRLSTVVRDVAEYWRLAEYRNMRDEIDAYMRESGAALANVRLAHDDYPETMEW